MISIGYKEELYTIILSEDAKGLHGNLSCNQDGELRDKQMVTLVGSIEKQFNRDFEVMSNKELGNHLKENNIKSKSDLINSDLGKKNNYGRNQGYI